MTKLFARAQEAVVVNSSLAWERHLKSNRAGLSSQVRVEAPATLLIRGACNAPGQRKHEQRRQIISQSLHPLSAWKIPPFLLEVWLKERVKDVAQAAHELIIHSGDRFHQIPSEKVQCTRDEQVDMTEQRCAHCIGEAIRQISFGSQPRLHQRIPPKALWLSVHHAASADCGGACDSQIFYLEHHGHWFAQSNDLSGVQTQFLVVIKHSVHVFDPDCIDGSIENNPFQGRCLRICTLAHNSCQHAILPFLRVGIVRAIQLLHFD